MGVRGGFRGIRIFEGMERGEVIVESSVSLRAGVEVDNCIWNSRVVSIEDFRIIPITILNNRIQNICSNHVIPGNPASDTTS